MPGQNRGTRGRRQRSPRLRWRICIDRLTRWNESGISDAYAGREEKQTELMRIYFVCLPRNFIFFRACLKSTFVGCALRTSIGIKLGRVHIVSVRYSVAPHTVGAVSNRTGPRPYGNECHKSSSAAHPSINGLASLVQVYMEISSLQH